MSAREGGRQVADDGGPGTRTTRQGLPLYANPLRQVTSASTWRATWYLLAYLVVGWVLFGVVLAAGIATLALAITLVSWTALVRCYARARDAEAYAFHAEFATRNPELYQPETLRRIRTGAEVGEEAYGKALQELKQTRNTANRIFETIDLLVTPTVAVPPFKIADLLADPEALRGREQLTLRNTRPFNVLGWPTISVPCGQTSEGLPIGLQISGPPGAEAIVLSLAAAYERESVALNSSHA
jgi:Asp-tRNA(Asn)/Glu-tRNA(Gln) amidotransferase A subunit family amidase